MDPRLIQIKVNDLIHLLNWKYDEEVVVEVGGTAVGGIHQAEGVNPKWSTPFGLRKYNNDAFIIIKNISRNPVVPSEPDDTLIGHHLKPEEKDEVQPDD